MEGSQHARVLATAAAQCLPPFAEWLPSARTSLSASLDRHPAHSAISPSPPTSRQLSLALTAVGLDVQQNRPFAANWPQLAATPADRAAPARRRVVERRTNNSSRVIGQYSQSRYFERSTICTWFIVCKSRAGYTTIFDARIRYKMDEMRGNELIDMIQMNDCTSVAISIRGRASLVAFHV